MTGTARSLMAVATLLGFAAGRVAYGQEANRLGAPSPVSESELRTTTPAPETVRPWSPAEYRLPPIAVPSDCPFQGGDPRLDLPDFPPPGLFATVELGLIRPHFANKLNGIVGFGGGLTDVVAVPAADLDWTAAPRVELGYRIPDGAGELLLSYRFLISEGQSDVLSEAGPLHLKSRLDTNVFDFDYANRDPLLTHWEMRWRAGARLAFFYFDSQADRSMPEALITGAPVQQRDTSRFVGAGPHAGLELFRRFEVPGLAFYAAVDGAGMYGRVHHTFQESFTINGPAPFGYGTYGKSQGVAMVGAQVGLSWSPPGYSASRFFLGYQWEYWAQVGRDDNTAPPKGSMGQLIENGIFFRGEFTF
jgi:hypothetical protein